MFKIFKNSRKILGMNARNLDYIRPYNLNKARLIADDKLLSKRIMKKEGLPVPRLIAKIKNAEDLEKFDWNSLPASFALKPNRGFGGDGIIVVYGKKKNGGNIWIKANGTVVSENDLISHVRNIIDGAYSLSNTPDIAFFEERLQLLKLFKPYSFKGIPDIRVIVFNKIPVMAMLRLPTKDSGGKANLALGAIGVGIDLATGTTTTAVIGKGTQIDYVPKTRMLLSGIKIPYWKEILKFAVQAQEVSGLGFLGADVAIDKERGPVFLELNARPGLSIQVANLTGLKERLERVKGLKVRTIEKGVRMGMDLFGGEIEEELEEISGKRVIGSVEKVTFTGKDEKKIEVETKIDTGAASTSIDIELARQLGFSDVIDFFEKIELPTNFQREDSQKIIKELKAKHKHPDLVDIDVVFSSHGVSIRPKVRMNFFMDGFLILASVNIVSREDLKYSAIIGKRNLGRFLVDVNK